MFSKSSPLIREKAPVVALQPTEWVAVFHIPVVAKAEIISIYERWARTDSGGVIKAVRAALGALEDMETVSHFPSILGLKHNSLAFDDHIKNRAVGAINLRLQKHLQEGETAIQSLEKTVEHIHALLSGKLSTMPAPVRAYCTIMASVMSELIALRIKVLQRIAQVRSFNEEFDQLQLFLLVLSETSENFVTSRAAAAVVREFPGTPTTLEELKQNGGKNLFTKVN